MNSTLIATAFGFIGLIGILCGFGMWYAIIKAVCGSKDFDFDLYKKWGSPNASGFMINPKDQMAIIAASFEIAFSDPCNLTINKDLQNRFRRIRKIVLFWNIGIAIVMAIVGVTVIINRV